MSKELGRHKSFHTNLEHNPKLVEQLAGSNASVSMKKYQEIDSLIGGETLKDIRFVMDAFTAQVSTLEKTNIIYEHGASFCSLLVGIDQRGQVVSLHKPIYGRTEVELKQTLQEANFLEQVERCLDDTRTFFLTGTGSRVTTSERQYLMQNLKKILGQEINYLFLKNEDESESELESNHKRFGMFERLKRRVLGGKTEEYKAPLIDEIVIIPKNISNTNRTEIVIPYDSGIGSNVLPWFRSKKIFVNQMKKKYFLIEDASN